MHDRLPIVVMLWRQFLMPQIPSTYRRWRYALMEAIA